jgi:hypothetical protein
MKRLLPLLLTALFAAAIPAPAPGAAPSEAEAPSSDAATAGAALAARLRVLEPAESSEVSGFLLIKGRGQPVRQIPIVCRVIARAASWDSIYETAVNPVVGAQKLVIQHFTNAPSLFFLASAPPGSSTLPELKPVPPDHLEAPLAGSDFSLGELGLDFLFWPEQNQLKGEMRLGEPCYVLESKSASGQRIKSWIDKESVGQGSPGLLIAECYNASGALAKEFDLGGGSFKKVHGRYQLQQMKIRSFKPRSETTLKFNLPEPKK